jgi:hypothetical protein
MFKRAFMIFIFLCGGYSNAGTADVSNQTGENGLNNTFNNNTKNAPSEVNSQKANASQLESMPTSLGKDCSQDLPQSQRGSACWEFDIDRDGEPDRARVASVGEFA